MQLILYTADCVGNAKNCKYPRKAVVTSADELQDAVSTDHVCAQYQGNYRSVDNFISSNVVVITSSLFFIIYIFIFSLSANSHITCLHIPQG